MENILNLKTYNKYKSLIDEGQIIIPNEKITDIADDINKAYRAKPFMRLNETHEVMLKAGKKVRITSRGSLRDIEIEGITYDSSEQAACNIYDPYDKFINLYNDIRLNPLDYTFIPILDPKYDEIRYTISKYSKGLSKYFNPHKVVKAVYSMDNIIFYVKVNNDILRKYCFRIGCVNFEDLMPSICKSISQKNGPESNFYIAFFIHQEDLPFTVGACKEDFYALKDILNRISFKGTTPLKYLIFEEIKKTGVTKLKDKENIAISYAMLLSNTTKKELSNHFKLDIDTIDSYLSNDELEILDGNGTKLNRPRITKFLNIIDNLNELKYYEEANLMWKVKYNDIPDTL